MLERVWSSLKMNARNAVKSNALRTPRATISAVVTNASIDNGGGIFSAEVRYVSLVQGFHKQPEARIALAITVAASGLAVLN